MTRIPDAVAVASLDTHRLIVTVPNEGPVDIACNVPRRVAADVLRQIADGLDSPAGQCSTARATGAACPIHDAPASPSEALLAAGAEAPAAFARGMAQAQRPDGLDALLDAVAASIGSTEQPATDWVDDVRSALAFNERAEHPAVITLRDVLLDDAPRTPAQALAAARIILAAYTRDVSAAVRKHADDYRDEHGVNRSTRGLLTGKDSIRKLLDGLALDLDEQAGQ
ncbi:hypothetical protein ACQF36_41460 [Streptomyces sp. Marseille-Q5077]|uniref:hypothetical protein n=1 Tax=Streptomyces sp. Marseille-Q5077 TaxID=3418995 RepID=UPI003CFF4C49